MLDTTITSAVVIDASGIYKTGVGLRAGRRSGCLPAERIVGVENGGCPHTAIREAASMNLQAIADVEARFPRLALIVIQSGGDVTIYVIDVADGDKIPAKGGPGIMRTDLLLINKIDLAP